MMLSKIEPSLLQKVGTLSKKKEFIDCIIYSNNFYKTKKEIEKFFNYSCVCELPFIKAFGVKVEGNNIFSLASINSIKYITASSQVFAMIDRAKEIVGVTGENVTNAEFSCAVLDTGVYPHLDFMLGNFRIKHFVDFINSSTVPYDDNGHGTIVASLLCGSGLVSGGKYAGVDSKTNLIVLKALDKRGEADAISILKAMQWVYDNRVRHKIKIVCMSFGSSVLDKNDPLMTGAEILWNSGIVVVAAAGNNGPDSETIMSPASSPRIITVGAMDDGRKQDTQKFKVASFSSRGPAFNNYKPDLIVSGVDIVGANIFDVNKKFYTSMSGTSVATPIVAGVCSLLIKKHPNYSPNMIKKLLIDNCNKLTGNRNEEGFGWLDVKKLRI